MGSSSEATKDFVAGLLVFNIRHHRYRLIVYPVFSRRKLYLKALLTHKEHDTKEWQHRINGPNRN